MIQTLIEENKNLRRMNQELHSTMNSNTGEGNYHDDSINNDVFNELLKSITSCLIFWERAKGRISAEYTLWRLANALDGLGKKYYTKNKENIYARGGNTLDSQIESEIKASQAYDQYIKQKGRK